jgi:hypothetical protein
VTGWTDERIWDAVEAWRWIPPSATRVVTDEYELAVTPGSFALTYVYGFRVDDADQVDGRLKSVRRQIESRGGTGARFRLTPRSRPSDLAVRLERRGYTMTEEADVFVWELRDALGGLRVPASSAVAGVSVAEVRTDPEYDQFLELGTTIFGDPPPSATSRAVFLSEFHRAVEQDGHSDRFLASVGSTPIGRGGMELVGPVARFWGTGVRAEHRQRGVYGALVRARCEAAAQRGAEIVLVIARVGSSGPILRRHGFRPVGRVRTFEAQW